MGIVALYDLKNQYDSGPFPPSSYDENAQSNFADMTPKQKEYFFRMLLEKLNQSLCTTCCPAGPAQTTSRELNLASSSLPPISKGLGQSTQLAGPGGDGANLTHFLHSVTSKGQYSTMPVDTETKSTQTSTHPADPCYKDGLWNEKSRSIHSDVPKITPHHVRSDVRGWGPKAATHASSKSNKPRR